MARVFVNDSTLTDIADAIREKNGTEDTYKPSQMADAVRAIESGGQTDNSVFDYRLASNVAFNGALAELPQKMTVILFAKDGTQNLFLNLNTIEEVTVIHEGDKRTNMYRTFYAPSGSNKVLKKFTLDMDTSAVTDFRQAFSHMQNVTDGVEIIGELDFTSAVEVNNTFQSSTGIKEVRFKKETLSLSMPINNTAILSDTSIQSIIEGLATVETSQTLAFHADVKAKLTEEQIATITSKNWTLA